MKQMTTQALQMPDHDYPFVHTKASQMVRSALKKAASQKGWSQRYIASLLGYKNSVVLSHVANGRIPTSINRAADYARILSMPVGEYLLAVLEQRHPEINFKDLFQIDNTGAASMLNAPSQSFDLKNA